MTLRSVIRQVNNLRPAPVGGTDVNALSKWPVRGTRLLSQGSCGLTSSGNARESIRGEKATFWNINALDIAPMHRCTEGAQFAITLSSVHQPDALQFSSTVSGPYPPLYKCGGYPARPRYMTEQREVEVNKPKYNPLHQVKALIHLSCQPRAPSACAGARNLRDHYMLGQAFFGAEVDSTARQLSTS